MLALSRLDMARMVQFLRALKLDEVLFLAPSTTLHFSSVASSEQSFSRFMNSVKYLQSHVSILIQFNLSGEIPHALHGIIIIILFEDRLKMFK